MSVKVGVRVRPFNQRQSDLNCKLCVEMIGNMTRLFDAEDPEGGKHRDYTFDYSFWSHDEFEVDSNGYFVPSSGKYADQRLVFEQVGVEILNNAWQGYHCCLFAYGQTGAGKSYSMVGYGANKGIVPISCEEVFNRIAANEDKNKEYEVMVSMMEIYNEKVQDLLIPIAKRPPEGHKIREHKTLGIYVEGMSKHFVDTYESIEKKMEEGGRNRSVAATAMNASSSRAHTIISIEFKQTVVEAGKKREKLSVIHLVDLAGSEKVGKTGATGDRLKEAAGINKSLSVLGLVISALADKATGKGKNVIVPYRDSCLTRILQNALGGNSKTLMICAISPATDNYDETLSTLRYADQAKKIQNKAVVNESETDKLIRTLTEEREELRLKVQKMEEMLSKFSMGTMGTVTPDMLEQLKEAKEQQRYVNETIADREATKEDKKKQEQEEQSNYAAKVDVTQPHISNLNQDPQLSRKINYPLTQDTPNNIGRRNVTPPNHIEIGGMGIRHLHALIRRVQVQADQKKAQPQGQQKKGQSQGSTQKPESEEGEKKVQADEGEKRLQAEEVQKTGQTEGPSQKSEPEERSQKSEWEWVYVISPQGSYGQESNCYLNGDQIFKQQRVFHLDRLSFGTNNMFLLLLPGGAVREEVEEKKIDWEFAQNELYLKKSQLEKQALEERDRRMREEAEAMLLEKEKLLRELENSLKESEEQKKKSAEQFEKEKIEIERRVREEREQEARKLKEEIEKKKERLREGLKSDSQNKEKYYFERKLLKTLPKCIELNLIAKEFRKNVTMSVKMMLSDVDEDDEESIELKKRSIMIKVVNKDAGYCYWWDPDTLSNRYYIIKDMSEHYFETGVVPALSDKEDPFWDPPASALIGRCFLTTKALTYMFDNPATLPMIGEDEQCGELLVNLVPTDETGTRNLCEEMDEEEVEFEPEELLDKPFHFLILIHRGVIPLHYKDIFVEYNFKVTEFAKDAFKTKLITDTTTVPLFDYRKLHSFAIITEPLLKYLSQTKLIFKVYGTELVEVDKKKEPPKPKESPIEPARSPADTSKDKPKLDKKPSLNIEPAPTSTTTAAKPTAAPAKKTAPADTSAPAKKGEMKHGNSKTNNKINERDINNAKEKDCEIY